MFIWRTNAILSAFDQWMPEMKQAWEKAEGRPEYAYPLMPATSIDYGIMEKAKNVVTFPLDCGWDDLGSWTSLDLLAQSLGTLQNANVINSGKVVPLDSYENIIDVPGKTVTLLGIKNLIVVEQGEVLMLAHKDRAQDIRQMVEAVKKTRPDLV
jgi:mannose-1-phosphate guanylyltransferase